MFIYSNNVQDIAQIMKILSVIDESQKRYAKNIFKNEIVSLAPKVPFRFLKKGVTSNIYF